MIGRSMSFGRAPAFASVAVAAALVVSGCGDDPAGPDGGPRVDADLAFARPAAGAPDLLTTDTTVVATRGEALRVELYYEEQDEPGTRGDRFLRFELDDESLLRYPDDHPRSGAAFEVGDTVSITISVAADTLLASLEPTGLRFDPEEPAELEMSWIQADEDDLDADGEPEDEGDIDLWRQERPGEPWFRIGELKDLERDEIEALLTSFTRYALAF